MNDVPSFTVRPLPPTASLDGAFRVHIPTKDLEILSLKPGELCSLKSEDGSTGVGIAWRSLDSNAKPHAHPVKLTDTLRDAFGFKLGNQLTITKANTQIHHADRVVVIDVSDHATADPLKDDKNWKWRCGLTLGNVEAIASGVAFEAASRKGLKRRFLIEHIESSSSSSNSLYAFDDRSELVLQDEASTPSPVPNPPRSFMITSEGIGGLNKQIELLNKRLVRLIGQIRGRRLPPQIQRNGGILLYGPEGTGKSLLLERVAQAPWRRVIRVDHSALNGTTSKNQATLRSLFGDAIAQQPSVIIIDDLEVIAGAQQRDSASIGNLTTTLVAELDKLKNTQVLVVAATHSPNDIDKSLRTPGRFRYEIEVPIPDRQARIDILKSMHGSSSQPDHLAEAIGERTHGFVGQDLEALYNNALEHAVDRFHQSEDWVVASTTVGRDSLATLVNTIREPAGEAVDEDEIINVQASVEDYERALLDVRPTAMKEVFLETPKVYWSDIGGSGEVKETLKEVVEWPLKYASHMETLNLTPQKGILFYGPPGCSKTLTAKAVATSSGLNFLAVKGAELTSMYVGESERAVREVFRKARAAAPSIIFFDEIDSIGSERDASGTKGLNVLTTLLNEMDGIESLKGVLVLAATNKPEVLDPALLRPGRFDSLFYISPPNESARKEILRIRTRSVPLDSDVDLDRLAQRTVGYSGAEIVEICLEAARSTMRRRVKVTETSAKDRRRAQVTKSSEGEVTSGDYDADAAPDANLKVSNEDFDQALQHAVRRITPEMTRRYEEWRDGLNQKL
ncbi:hypothetical protein MBLNU459_g0576t2 [Dothideomycetes sp. NU459]